MKIPRPRQLQNRRLARQAVALGAAICAIGLAASSCRAQAAAEAAAATSSGSVMAGSSKHATTAAGKSAKPVASAHVPASNAPPVEDANRKSLEDNAGRNAGKLMLHSTPNGAQVFVNGLYVGHAPLLLLLAPATYKIEMRGTRQELGKRTITVAPEETQEVVVTLSSMYPDKVSTR